MKNNNNYLFFLIGLSSVFIFFGINNITEYIFDEFHYIPAAKEVLKGNLMVNLEHPPLGKYLMAIGIYLFGDRPLGWRFFGALLGLVSILTSYVYGRRFFKSERYGFFFALVILFNGFVFVNARLAMLDIYAFAFMLCSLTCFLYGHETNNRYHYLSGLFLGLAMASKLSIAPLVLLFLLYTLGSKTFNLRNLKRLFFSVFLPGALVYFICYLPILITDDKAGFFSLFGYQLQMLDLQSRVSGDHPYLSQWYEWPLMIRPIWYHFKIDPNVKIAQGVAMIANPLVIWGGLLAMLYNIYSYIRNRSYRSFTIFISYATLYFFWAVIPREISFFYYYMPASFFLSLGLVKFLKDYDKKFKYSSLTGMVLIAILFFYYYPVYAGVKVENFNIFKWSWFQSWI